VNTDNTDNTDNTNKSETHNPVSKHTGCDDPITPAQHDHVGRLNLPGTSHIDYDIIKLGNFLEDVESLYSEFWNTGRTPGILQMRPIWNRIMGNYKASRLPITPTTPDTSNSNQGR